MSRLYTPQDGDLLFTKIRGFTGLITSFGLWLIGDPFRFDHVFVVVGDQITEAMPGGARRQPFRRTYKSDVMAVRFPLTGEQRAAIPAAVAEMERNGMKYSFASYPLLGLLRFGFRPKWYIDYVARSKRHICSQWGDRIHHSSGYNIFNDGRVVHDVSPADLAYAGIEQGEVWMLNKDADGYIITG